MGEAKHQRAKRLRAEVIKHDSYVIVANQEGLTRERVRQIAGNGLTSLSRGPQPMKCMDCKRRYKAVMRPGHDGRCERCHTFFEKHGLPWSREAAEKVRRHTHCKNGHEMTKENTYFSRSRKTGKVTRACRICKRRAVNAWANTPEGKARIRERNKQQYAKMKADPELWAKQQERVRNSQRRKRAKELLHRKDN